MRELTRGFVLTQLKRLPADESAAVGAAAGARVVPPATGFPSHFTMNMNVNITTSSMNNSRPLVTISAKPSPANAGPTNQSPHNSNQSDHSPSHAQALGATNEPTSGLPPVSHVHASSGGRKRKSSHSKKSANNSSKEKESSVETPPPSAGSSGGSSKAKSPFEKLNTLKMLLDCGHLTADEYQERKTQIINEMTGTSTERKKPSPRRALQPIMKTVVPHNPPDFGRLVKERAEKLSFDVDTLEWHSTSTRVKLDLVPFATGQLRNAYYLQVRVGS